MTSRDLRCPEVIPKWRHLTGSHQEVAVEGQKLLYTVYFTSYKAVTRMGGSHLTGNDEAWLQVTVSDPEKTSLDRKSPGSCLEGKKLAYTVHFTSYKAVTCRRRQSRWREWHHVTSGDQRWPGSDVIRRKSPPSGCRRPKPPV